MNEDKSTLLNLKLKIISDLILHWRADHHDDDWYGKTFDKLYDSDLSILLELEKLKNKKVNE